MNYHINSLSFALRFKLQGDNFKEPTKIKQYNLYTRIYICMICI